MTSATTGVNPLASFESPLRLKFDYFTDDKARPRGVAKMPGIGPTWVAAYVRVPDKSGNPLRQFLRALLFDWCFFFPYSEFKNSDRRTSTTATS